jgi:S-DNA-T family DNA segregation ATPase FtsK/SpoIIIE
VRAIAALVDEMERRYDLLEKSFTKNIKDYNEQTEDRILPYIVCVIDEFADLMASDKAVEKDIQRLAQKARACGIHLILATQRPSVDVVTGVLKANFPTRLAYKVASNADSRTILDCGGAEKLIGRGDALFLAGDGKLQRIHGAYLPDNEIKKIVDDYRGDIKEVIKPKKIEDNSVIIKTSGKVAPEKKKEGWFARAWKWWCNLGVRQRKVIINGVIYLFNVAVNGATTTKKRK